jgi:hypothetical protein
MFNFRNGTALAAQQDQYLKIYLAGSRITSRQISDMEQNLWVATASKLAPGNLVVRQWCLIDLFKGNPTHEIQIYEIMNLLSYKSTFPPTPQGNLRIFAEGYSYFCYTMDVLGPWLSKFKKVLIMTLVEKIKQGFLFTSYPRKGVWYPAPFGDLRNTPLHPDLQIDHPITPRTVSNVILNYFENKIWYNISGKPIGLNTHIPKDPFTIEIKEGIPERFKFYEGYDKKYKNSREEFKDIFDSKRVASIPC